MLYLSEYNYEKSFLQRKKKKGVRHLLYIGKIMAFFVGFINQYPGYTTQGETLDELKENLIDLWMDTRGQTLFVFL